MQTLTRKSHTQKRTVSVSRMRSRAPQAVPLNGLFSTLKKVVKGVIKLPAVRASAAFATGGNSEIYYQGAQLLKDVKGTAQATSPVPAETVVTVTKAPAAPAAIAPISALETYKLPLAVGGGLLLLTLAMRK